MQFDTADAEHGAAGGRFSTYVHPVAAIFDRLHMDCGYIDANACRTSEMDSLGFIAQFYASFGNYCVHNYSTVFSCPSECGKYTSQLCILCATQR